MALGFMRHSLWGSPQSVMAFISMWMQHVLPAPEGPRVIIPWRTRWVSNSCKPHHTTVKYLSYFLDHYIHLFRIATISLWIFFQVESYQWPKKLVFRWLPWQGVWRYGICDETGQLCVSILRLGEIESLICNFYLSMAARTIVWANPSLRYTSKLLWYQATNKKKLPLTKHFTAYQCWCTKLVGHTVYCWIHKAADKELGYHDDNIGDSYDSSILGIPWKASSQTFFTMKKNL